MIVLFKPNSSIERNEMLWNWILIPVLFLSIILLGNYGIFLGHTFFLDENNYLIFKFSAENIKSSGWRPDVGLGNTYLYGDPGTFHTWSLVRWWGHLFPSPLLAFNTSIIISLWVACIVQYIFLRKVIPGLGKSISFALAAMIAFGPDRYLSFFWQNSWGISPIIVPVIALLLYDFFKKPLIKHYFIYTLVLVLSLNLGSSVVLLHTIIFSGAFFLIIIFFNGYHRQWKVFLSQLGRFFLLNITAGFSIIILSGWTFYGIYIESQITEYVRDPIYGSGPFFFPPSIKFFVERLLDYIYSGIFAPWTKNLGIQQIVVSTGRNCPFPLFPIIFLVYLINKL